MTDPEINKCYEMVLDDKKTYVGRFKKRLGGGRYNTGMANYFTKEGKEIEVISRYPPFAVYNEVTCKNADKAAGGRRSLPKQGTRRRRRGGSLPPLPKVSPEQLAYAKNTFKTGLAAASFVPGPIGLGSRIGSVGLSVYNQGGLNLKDPVKMANKTLKSLPVYKKQMELVNKATQMANKYKHLIPAH